MRKYFELPNAVFVGHAVAFDYSFVNLEFEHAKMPPLNLPTLDTLKLAQRILPDDVKKNVGAMAKYFGFYPVNVHRAFDDALATAYSLIEMLDRLHSDNLIYDYEELMRFQDNKIYSIKQRLKKIEHIKPQFQELPETPGSFNLFDENEALLYSGYAKNLKNKVSNLFAKSKVHSQALPQLIANTRLLKFQKSNSELSAILQSIEDVIANKPIYNAIPNSANYSFIKITNNEFPAVYRCVKLQNDGADYIGPFSNKFLADDIILKIQKKFRIRKCRNDLAYSQYCLYRDSNECFNPCGKDVSKNLYYEELGQLKQYILNGHESSLINKINKLSSKMKFEAAAFLRNQLYDLKKVEFNPSKALINESLNYVAIVPHSSSLALYLYIIKNGLLTEDILITPETDQSIIYDALNTYDQNKKKATKKADKKEFTKSEISQQQLIKKYLTTKNGDVNRISISNGTNLLDIFEECITLIDNYFVT
ncbi:MAG: hypothetical protein B7C24_14255 [Bacteroidetes bacterium 4572_77]|nr:MAG: hypothetical protein B7C24_14255 [Bacteroidetes bacterium 4572_77]